MSCLNITIALSNSTPNIEVVDASSHLLASCSLVCSVGADEPSYMWAQGVKMLWDNGGLILIDSEE